MTDKTDFSDFTSLRKWLLSAPEGSTEEDFWRAKYDRAVAMLAELEPPHDPVAHELCQRLRAWDGHPPGLPTSLEEVEAVWAASSMRWCARIWHALAAAAVVCDTYAAARRGAPWTGPTAELLKAVHREHIHEILAWARSAEYKALTNCPVRAVLWWPAGCTIEFNTNYLPPTFEEWRKWQGHAKWE